VVEGRLSERSVRNLEPRADAALRFLVLRHGRSVANERGLIVSSFAHAGQAYGLTTLGRDQVTMSVTDAEGRGELSKPLALVSSPLLRARESAEVAGDILGASLVADDRLIERDFGDFEMGPDGAYERIWAADRRDPTHTRWGVESVTRVLRRAGAVVEEWARGGHTGTVLLCTHGDVASALLCASLGVALGRHREVGALETGAIEMLPAVELVLNAWAALPIESR
jgi:broad specificity phosphatase PhoE